jgi:predicted RNA-binding protein associated with RNAse of E/G family
VVSSSRPGWLALEAFWAMEDATIDGVRYERGGLMREYFSPAERFNVFQVFGRDGKPGGVYANITAPTRLELDQHGRLELVWEDHWLDVVKDPDGTVVVLDEAELDQSGLDASHPTLATQIRLAKDKVLEQFEAGIWDARTSR